MLTNLAVDNHLPGSNTTQPIKIGRGAGGVAVDTGVVVEAWVRTRRDSKAGLSFIQVSDGSCQGTIQVVAKKELSNYEDAVQKLTAGSSLIVRGTLVESKGRGQSVEIQAAEVEVLGQIGECFP